MNTSWFLTMYMHGYKKNSRWFLIRIDGQGWYMENLQGYRTHWGNPNLFSAYPS